jgi:hypothetical protein
MNLKPKLESGSSHFSFNTLNFRRFQGGFDRVNAHRPTMPPAAAADGPSIPVTRARYPLLATSFNASTTFIS